MIKLLIVDDSAFMRMALRKMVEGNADIRVVGEAKDGVVAVRMAQELRPDVITMDVEMPELDGIEATRAIMASAPCAIIMLSSLTTSGAVTTIKALEMGALDFISKKSSFVQLDIAQIGGELVEKIRYWALHRASLRSSTPGALPSLSKKIIPAGKVGLVVVGVSTGGPAAMPTLLHSMGRLACPMVIAQHMPAVFTKGFADHMRYETGLNVLEGRNGMALEPGMVIVAPGGTDSIVREPFPGRLMVCQRMSDTAPIHPNADVLFQSAAVLSVAVVAIIMTGMGNDGVKGAQALALRNTPVLVQEPSTCVVDGMPGSAIEAGVATESLMLEEMGRRLAKWCN